MNRFARLGAAQLAEEAFTGGGDLVVEEAGAGFGAVEPPFAQLAAALVLLGLLEEDLGDEPVFAWDRRRA